MNTTSTIRAKKLIE